MKKFSVFLFLLMYTILSICNAQDTSQSTIDIENIKTGPQVTTISLIIDVPNKYLENKNILETATIYGIDSKILAEKISEHYFNRFQVEEMDEISELEKKYGLNIQEIKEIAVDLQEFYPANQQQKEKLVTLVEEEKIMSQTEFIFWSVVIILSLYFLSYFLTYRELIHHNIHRHTWNTLLLLSFIGYGIIILSYLIPQIYGQAINLQINIIYQNLRIGFVIIFLGFSHALRYLLHYRQLKKKYPAKFSKEKLHIKDTQSDQIKPKIMKKSQRVISQKPTKANIKKTISKTPKTKSIIKKTNPKTSKKKSNFPKRLPKLKKK